MSNLRLDRLEFGGALLTCVKKNDNNQCIQYLQTCEGEDCISVSPKKPDVPGRKKRPTKKRPISKKPKKKRTLQPVKVEKKKTPTRKPPKKQIEPWEMTRSEWEKAIQMAAEGVEKGYIEDPNAVERLYFNAYIYNENTKSGIISHKDVIAKAVNEKKKIPGNVLEEYPDIRSYANSEDYRTKRAKILQVKKRQAENIKLSDERKKIQKVDQYFDKSVEEVVQMLHDQPSLPQDDPKYGNLRIPYHVFKKDGKTYVQQHTPPHDSGPYVRIPLNKVVMTFDKNHEQTFDPISELFPSDKPAAKAKQPAKAKPPVKAPAKAKAPVKAKPGELPPNPKAWEKNNPPKMLKAYKGAILPKRGEHIYLVSTRTERDWPGHDTDYQPIIGKPILVPGLGFLELFIHESLTDPEMLTISDVMTGQAVASGTDKEIAITNAAKLGLMVRENPEATKKALKEKRMIVEYPHLAVAFNRLYGGIPKDPPKPITKKQQRLETIKKKEESEAVPRLERYFSTLMKTGKPFNIKHAYRVVYGNPMLISTEGLHDLRMLVKDMGYSTPENMLVEYIKKNPQDATAPRKKTKNEIALLKVIDERGDVWQDDLGDETKINPTEMGAALMMLELWGDVNEYYNQYFQSTKNPPGEKPAKVEATAKNRLIQFFRDKDEAQEEFTEQEAYEEVYRRKYEGLKDRIRLKKLINKIGYTMLDDMYQAHRRGDFTPETSGLSGALLTCRRWIVVGKGKDALIKCGSYRQTCLDPDAECAEDEKITRAKKKLKPKAKKPKKPTPEPTPEPKPKPDSKKEMLRKITKVVTDVKPETISQLAKRFEMTSDQIIDIITSPDATVAVRTQHGQSPLVVPADFQAELKDYEQTIMHQVTQEKGITIQKIADNTFLDPIFVRQALLDLEKDKKVKITPNVFTSQPPYKVTMTTAGKKAEKKKVVPQIEIPVEQTIERQEPSQDQQRRDAIMNAIEELPQTVNDLLVVLNMSHKDADKLIDSMVKEKVIYAESSGPVGSRLIYKEEPKNYGAFWFNIVKGGTKIRRIDPRAQGPTMEEYLDADKGKAYLVFGRNVDTAERELSENLKRIRAINKEHGRGWTSDQPMKQTVKLPGQVTATYYVQPVADYEAFLDFTQDQSVNDMVTRKLLPGHYQKEEEVDPWKKEKPFTREDNRRFGEHFDLPDVDLNREFEIVVKLRESEIARIMKTVDKSVDVVKPVYTSEKSLALLKPVQKAFDEFKRQQYNFWRYSPTNPGRISELKKPREDADKELTHQIRILYDKVKKPLTKAEKTAKVKSYPWMGRSPFTQTQVGQVKAKIANWDFDINYQYDRKVREVRDEIWEVMGRLRQQKITRAAQMAFDDFRQALYNMYLRAPLTGMTEEEITKVRRAEAHARMQANVMRELPHNSHKFSVDPKDLSGIGAMLQAANAIYSLSQAAGGW